MSEFEVRNHLWHPVNTFSSHGLPERNWGASDRVPRAAEETVAILGILKVREHSFPVLQQRFTKLLGGDVISDDPNILDVLSQEALQALLRSGRPIDGAAYPLGIERDAAGRVLGCRGLGMPVLGRSAYKPEKPLTQQEISAMSDPALWLNLAHIPLKMYSDADTLPESDVLNAGAEPIVELPTALDPVAATPVTEFDPLLSEKFNVPIFRVYPEIEGGIQNLDRIDPEKLAFLHLFPYRAMARMGGLSTRNCVTVGKMVRDPQTKTVVGGTAVYWLDPEMLANDQM